MVHPLVLYTYGYVVRRLVIIIIIIQILKSLASVSSNGYYHYWP